MVKLRKIGTDEWCRPVYRDESGKIWKDTNLGNGKPSLSRALNDDFEGEPDYPLKKEYEIVEHECSPPLDDLLEGKTIFIESSEDEVDCIIIVNNCDASAARNAIKQAVNIWHNHPDSDEHIELLSDQIAYILESKYIDYLMPDFEELPKRK